MNRIQPGAKGAVLRPFRPGSETSNELSSLIAKMMDTVFIIPGTNVRFGFDAIIGLFPGVGDGIGAIISSFLIAQGARSGVPRIVLARMAGNVLINTVVGAVPIFGDVFSVFFKSNLKNYDLLLKHGTRRAPSTSADWLFVSALLLALLVFVALVIWGIVAVGSHILSKP